MNLLMLLFDYEAVPALTWGPAFASGICKRIPTLPRFYVTPSLFAFARIM